MVQAKDGKVLIDMRWEITRAGRRIHWMCIWEVKPIGISNELHLGLEQEKIEELFNIVLWVS